LVSRTEKRRNKKPSGDQKWFGFAFHFAAGVESEALSPFIAAISGAGSGTLSIRRWFMFFRRLGVLKFLAGL